MRTLEKDSIWSTDEIEHKLTQYMDEFHPHKTFRDPATIRITLLKDVDLADSVGRFKSHLVREGFDKDWFEQHKPDDIEADEVKMDQVVRALELFLQLKHIHDGRSYMTDESIHFFMGSFQRLAWSSEYHELLARDNPR